MRLPRLAPRCNLTAPHAKCVSTFRITTVDVVVGGPRAIRRTHIIALYAPHHEAQQHMFMPAPPPTFMYYLSVYKV